jgi:hypothetical protein
MSKLAQPSGDDHPAAAEKNLSDAFTLLQQRRFDGAAYLSGYVVESALKTLWLTETGVPVGAAPWGNRGHNLSYLLGTVVSLAVVAGAKTAKYLGAATQALGNSAIAGWRPELRYRAPGMTESDADQWCHEAEAIFKETIGAMLLDGVI